MAHTALTQAGKAADEITMEEHGLWREYPALDGRRDAVVHEHAAYLKSFGIPLLDRAADTLLRDYAQTDAPADGAVHRHIPEVVTLSRQVGRHLSEVSPSNTKAAVAAAAL